ncbi:MAG: hypothetical protein DRJ43_01535 [Thermoprotei archaeon]|nr:MAG: hypothetical protein DRJ43_01535 [Thermoprotei archaeon]
MPIPPSHHSIRLAECEGLLPVLKLVVEAIERRIDARGRKRIRLGLQRMPDRVLAYHVVGSNLIVLNERMLHKVKAASKGNKVLVNSYLYHVILHEYLHMLGILDERRVSELVCYVCERELGPDHPATLMSKYGLRAILPELGVKVPLDDDWSDNVKLLRGEDQVVYMEAFEGRIERCKL